MSWYDVGNPPINSTGAGAATNPDTAALVAEILPAQFPTYTDDRNYRVTWIVGASTLATFRLEQCLSSGVDFSTSGRDVTVVQVPVNQTGQYVITQRIKPGDRLRVRMDAAITGVAVAKIQAEALT